MPKKPYMKNKRVLRVGCTLYNIDEAYKGGGTGIWYYRVAIENGGNKRRSTFTTVEADAEDIALEAFFNAKSNILNSIPNTVVLTSRVIQEWLQSEKKRIGSKTDGISQSTFNNYQKTGDKYLIAFFGKMDILTIDDNTILEYWEWRQDYYKNHKPKKTEKRIALNPKTKTLVQDQSSINRMFRFAMRKKYVVKGTAPEVKVPKTKNIYKKDVPRTAYSVAEFKTLSTFMDKHVKEAKGKDKLARDRMRQQVHIMVNTGLRAVECRHLRWRDVTSYTHPVSGNKFLRLWAQGKTTPRAIMADLGLMVHFQSLKELNPEHVGQDDLVFCASDGKFNNYAHQNFKAIALKAGVYVDKDSQTGRPLTSLRHTYITNALSTGSISPENLAANCGNSQLEIERTYRHVANELNSHNLVSNSDDGTGYKVKVILDKVMEGQDYTTEKSPPKLKQ